MSPNPDTDEQPSYSQSVKAQLRLREMILAGDVLDGATIQIKAGPEGLIIGDRVSASRRVRPSEAIVH
jgi:ATP-dependent Clp protease ATP-binding subunit ClpB